MSSSQPLITVKWSICTYKVAWINLLCWLDLLPSLTGHSTWRYLYQSSTLQIALAVDDSWPWSYSGVENREIDEAALRGATPSRRLVWRLSWLGDSSLPLGTLNCSARYTNPHACSPEFTDIIPAIDNLDADISFEASRSNLEILDELAKNFKQKLDLGYTIFTHHVSLRRVKLITIEATKTESSQVWINLTVVWRLAELKKQKESLIKLVNAAKKRVNTCQQENVSRTSYRRGCQSSLSLETVAQDSWSRKQREG